jgi:hypothetical protein
MVQVSQSRAVASRLKAPAIRLEVAASLPMAQARAAESQPLAEASLPTGRAFPLMVLESRLRVLAPGQQEQAKVSQPTELVPVPPAGSRPTAQVLRVLASQPMAPVLRVLALALASQQMVRALAMVPARALPGQASRQMAPVRVWLVVASRQPEPLPVSSRTPRRELEAMAAGCRSWSAGRR